MSEDIINKNFAEATEVLNNFIADKDNFRNILSAGLLLSNSLKKGYKIISCGNGGSMCDAMHFSEELSGSFAGKRKPLAAIAISDPGHITCVANDFGFEYVFSRYVESIGNRGDVLFAISTSGNSINVINAAEIAREKGMSVVALTGKDGGKLSKLCDVEIRIPWQKNSDRIQEVHIKIIHSLIALIEHELGVSVNS
jgi:D-sedoheptulose 7-phosphate isomerase